MAEIISIDGSNVRIGLDNGKITTVPIAVIAYSNPKAGDEVKIYKDGDETIIREVKTKTEVSEKSASPTIHINNTNAVQQTGIGTSEGVAKRVNKIAYLLLAFFVGWLGVHRFMRGQIGIGILYLLTFGLLGWGALIDLIIGLTKLNKYDSEFLFTRHGDWVE